MKSKVELLTEYFREKQIEEETISLLVNKFEFRKYDLGETILAMGERTETICLILKGLVRGYYMDEDGNEITKCFSKENDWCCIYNYFSEEVSSFTIQAIENVEVAVIHVAHLNHLIEENPQIRKLKDDMMQTVFLNAEKRVFSFASMDARQRYLEFKNNNPSLCSRIKQEYLASYLGVTPSSLSRIKRDL